MSRPSCRPFSSPSCRASGAPWASGDRVLVEAWLQQYPTLESDSESLLDLIYNEVVLREQKGEAPQRDEYLRRFPQLTAALHAQFDVHQAIQADATPGDEIGLLAIPDYELLEEIGHGGMGRVYKARHRTLDTLVAVKVLRAELCDKRALRKRFVTEVQAAAVLDHVHIVKVFQVGEVATQPFFIMELIDGPSLEEVIRRGRPDPMQAVCWLIAVAEAVHYAHGQGIIHRDLKPANIMIDAAGQPRVMDFGMAKILRQAAIAKLTSTKLDIILGTPSYMPPEQTGDHGIKPGPYSDVYSLGAILYALLTGQPPYDEGSFVSTVMKVRSDAQPPLARSLRPEIPEPLERICQTCLNKRPSDRFPSAGELAEVLRRFTLAVGQAAVTAPVSVLSLATGELIPLEKDVTVVGRWAGCDLILKKKDVSRRHCQIVRTPEQVIVEDLGSTQGTRVNGSHVTQTRLRDGDRLEIARQVFQVLLRE